MLSSLSNVFLTAAGWIALLEIADFLLPSRYKEKIRDVCLSIWYWLTTQHAEPYINRLRSERLFLISRLLSLAFLAIINLGLVVGSNINGFEPKSILLLFLGYRQVVGGNWWGRNLGHRIFLWTLRGNPWLIAVKLFLVLLTVVFFVLGPLVIISYMGSHNIGDDTNAIVVAAAMVILSAFFIGAMFVVYCLTLPVFAVFFVVIISVAGILLAICLFRVMELLTARIVESEKGPIIAVTIILALFGGVMKAASTPMPPLVVHTSPSVTGS